jgi:hypothetical protein
MVTSSGLALTKEERQQREQVIDFCARMRKERADMERFMVGMKSQLFGDYFS